MHLLVAYDITSDRRRDKLAKLLKGYLERVQYSLFEGKIPDTRLEKLKSDIERTILPEEDSVRIYRLCHRCQLATEIIGLGIYIDKKRDIIL